jgi:hypothetical protein
MAKCKQCKTDIPDGVEYCQDCLDKDKAKANESYLDSLLNSVKNTKPSTENAYKKKKESSPVSTEKITDFTSETTNTDEEMFRFDIGDIEDFDHFNIDEDLANLNTEEIISDEDLFGEKISSNTTESSKDFVPEMSEASKDKVQEISEASKDIVPKMSEAVKDFVPEMSETSKDIVYEMSEASTNIVPEISEDSMINNTPEDTLSEYNDVIDQMNMTEGHDNEEDDFDADLNELLNQLDSSQNNDEEIDEKTNGESDKIKDIPLENEAAQDLDTSYFQETPEDEDMELKPEDEDEDDFLSLLNQISSDDPVSDDVRAINDLMNGIPEAPAKGSGTPSNVGTVFSDALKAVSGLNDPNLNEEELLNRIPDKNDKKAKKEKSKKAKKTSGKKTGKGSEEQQNKNLFQRLFGNIEDKNASKKATNSINISDQEGTQTIDEPRQAKAKKGKKGKKGKEAETEDVKDTDKKGKGSKSDTEESEEVTDKKKSKKVKKQKSSEVIQVIDDIDEDVGRINRLGASIVFVFFGLLALLIYVGSNAVSYTLSIQHATSYFNKQKYTQAYDEVYGIDIDDDDVEIYSKIMTIMFVNKQLNSYNNYCALSEFPQALDSLLKGLKRYDKYIELATILGIKTDMDYVREQIMAELNNEFKLSEKDALSIINIEDMKEYSIKVYDVALHNE